LFSQNVRLKVYERYSYLQVAEPADISRPMVKKTLGGCAKIGASEGRTRNRGGAHGGEVPNAIQVSNAGKHLVSKRRECGEACGWRASGRRVAGAQAPLPRPVSLA
jgi:hypothetical protein